MAFEYLQEYTNVLPGVKYNKAKLRCEFPGPNGKVTIFLLSGSNESSEQIRGLYLDAVVLDEYADLPAKLLPEILRPAVADRKGSITIIGTPKSEDAFYDIYKTAKQKMEDGDPEWFACMYKADETGILDEAELASMRDTMSTNQYRAELLCDWGASISGAYYADQLEQLDGRGQIGQVPHDEAMMVNTSWDLGVRDKTSVWFYQEDRAGNIRVIDCYQDSGEGLGFYVQMLQRKAVEEGYVYNDHLFPHDVDTRSMDLEARRRSDILRQLGIFPRVVPMRKVAEGIEAVRALMPRCWFDAVKCEEGLKALRMYRVKETSGLPLHDEFSHFADSFRYLAIGHREFVDDGFGRKKWSSEIEYPEMGIV